MEQRTLSCAVTLVAEEDYCCKVLIAFLKSAHSPTFSPLFYLLIFVCFILRIIVSLPSLYQTTSSLFYSLFVRWRCFQAHKCADVCVCCLPICCCAPPLLFFGCLLLPSPVELLIEGRQLSVRVFAQIPRTGHTRKQAAKKRYRAHATRRCFVSLCEEERGASYIDLRPYCFPPSTFFQKNCFFFHTHTHSLSLSLCQFIF